MTANIDAMIREAINAYRAGKRADAHTILLKVTELDVYNEQAWLWLSAVVDTPEEQITCLENVITINPSNERAKKGLEVLVKTAVPKPSSTPSQPPETNTPSNPFNSSPFGAAPASPSAPSQAEYDDWVSSLKLNTTKGPFSDASFEEDDDLFSFDDEFSFDDTPSPKQSEVSKGLKSSDDFDFADDDLDFGEEDNQDTFEFDDDDFKFDDAPTPPPEKTQMFGDLRKHDDFDFDDDDDSEFGFDDDIDLDDAPPSQSTIKKRREEADRKRFRDRFQRRPKESPKPPLPTEPSKLEALRRRVSIMRDDPQHHARIERGYIDLRLRVQQKLLNELEGINISTIHRDELRRIIEETFNSILAEESLVLSRAERQRLFEAAVAEILGFGPLEILLADETITNILVNGPKNIFVEQKGHLTRAAITFEDEKHVLRTLDRMMTPLGRRIDEGEPVADGRLPDGSRVKAIIRPVSLNGPSLIIRTFSKKPLVWEDWIRFGSITPASAEFLRACVISGLNILVCGGINAGKTTLTNILSGFIPNDKRIVTVEKTAEMQLQHEHVVTLECHPPNVNGLGKVNLSDLIDNAFAMQSDVIVFGRGGERLFLTPPDHTNIMGTLDSGNPQDAVTRLEILGLTKELIGMPSNFIRQRIIQRLNIIVHMGRFFDGSIKVKTITEVQGLKASQIQLVDIFRYKQTGLENNKVIGRILPTGVRPECFTHFNEIGIQLDPEIFGAEQTPKRRWWSRG